MAGKIKTAGLDFIMVADLENKKKEIQRFDKKIQRFDKKIQRFDRVSS